MEACVGTNWSSHEAQGAKLVDERYRRVLSAVLAEGRSNQKRKSAPIEEKESFNWCETADRVGEQCASFLESGGACRHNATSGGVCDGSTAP